MLWESGGRLLEKGKAKGTLYPLKEAEKGKEEKRAKLKIKVKVPLLAVSHLREKTTADSAVTG